MMPLLHPRYSVESDWEEEEMLPGSPLQSHMWHEPGMGREWKLYLMPVHEHIRPQEAFKRSNEEVELRFRGLLSEWRAATKYESNLERIILNRSYQQIIGLGPQAVPLILSELSTSRGHWFWALSVIVGEDKAEGQTTISSATEAWLAWGRENGILNE